MLITFLALLALVNAIMGWGHLPIGWFPYSLQQVFGWVFAPIAWLIGIPWHDAPTIGNLLGTRMVLNEFVAFAQLGTMKDSLDPRSFTIATFALCGFANSVPSAFRSAESARSLPNSAANSPNSVFAPCSRHHGQSYVRLHRRNLFMSLSRRGAALLRPCYRGPKRIALHNLTLTINIDAQIQATSSQAQRRIPASRPRCQIYPREDQTAAAHCFGLGLWTWRFRRRIWQRNEIPYAKIPNFPQSTAIGHAGRLVIGNVGDIPVAAMQGRVHLYEGYSAKEVAFPIRVFAPHGYPSDDRYQRRRRHQSQLFARLPGGDSRPP